MKVYDCIRGGAIWVHVVSMAKRPSSSTCIAATILVVVTLGLVEGAPFPGPDLSTCRTRLWTPFQFPVSCCLKHDGKPLRDFEGFPADLPMRVRRPVHKLDEFRSQQLERGVALMRALPRDDPRSWYQQNKLHCSYTAAVYEQIGGPKPGEINSPVIVHGNWLFFPFHAWFLYFVERIIAKLVEDDTFAMPYWAWDGRDSATMPPIVANNYSSLWDSERNSAHAPPYPIDLIAYYDLHYHDHEFRNVEEQMQSNKYQLQRVFDESIAPEVFFGGNFTAGDQIKIASGPMESGPHLGIHTWVPDIHNKWGQDMAQTHVSARDPLFSMHHSQVDRLWRLWLSRGGKNLDDPDFLGAQFFFFDENAEFVRVNVSGTLDAEKMRVSYEEVENEWLQDEPQVTSIRARGDVKYPPAGMWNKVWRSLAETITANGVGNLFWGTKTSANVDLFSTGAASTAIVPRPSAGMLSRSVGSLEAFEEVLVVSGVVTKPFHLNALLKIFVELPEADLSTPQNCLESMGQIHLPSYYKSGAEETILDHNFEYKTGMQKKLRSLGISHLQSLTITFVSAWDPKYDVDVSVKFTNIRIEVQKLK